MNSADELRAELRAIEVWDALYYRATSHNCGDVTAYETRKARFQEIVSILGSNSCSLHSDGKAFRCRSNRVAVFRNWKTRPTVTH